MIASSGLEQHGMGIVPEADRLRAFLMGRRHQQPSTPVPLAHTAPSARPELSELVDVRSAVPGLLILDAPPWSDPERRFQVRPEVATRLANAIAVLPSDLRLGFWEGLRPVCVQRDLWRHGLEYFRTHYPQLAPTDVEPLLEQYIARPGGCVPPHSTGSAVDIAPIDVYGNVLTPETAWGRLGTKLFSQALRDAGLANYAPEWWHWSYGDDEWARVFDCAPLAFSTGPLSSLDEGPGEGI